MKRTKTWKSIKPHTISSRKKVYEKYGPKCFLDPKRKKYPVCNKYTGKQECMGHRAAQYYLNINIGKLKKTKDKISRRKRKKYLTIKKKTLKFTEKNCK